MSTLDGIDEVFEEVEFFEVDFTYFTEYISDDLDVDLEVILTWHLIIKIIKSLCLNIIFYVIVCLYWKEGGRNVCGE